MSFFSFKSRRKDCTPRKHISITNVICKLLVLVLIVSSLNLYCLTPIFASSDVNLESSFYDVDYSEVLNVSEIKSLRTKNSKTFIKENNSFEIEMYGEDIHYFDNDEYIKIDNTLKSNGNY